jgi:hypothetical protein
LVSRAGSSISGWGSRIYFAGTKRLELADKPDIVHCHNLHGEYFDLHALDWLSARVPVVITMHDAWLLSGHCVHSLGCGRWETGCGKCPDDSLSRDQAGCDRTQLEEKAQHLPVFPTAHWRHHAAG